MDAGSNPLLIGLTALVGLLVILGPPIWWYHHGRRPSKKKKLIWWAIIFGVIILSGTRPTAKSDWLGWAASIIRIEMGVWIIAWGVKGSEVQ